MHWSLSMTLLLVILVGENPRSMSYIRRKKSAAAEVPS